MVAAAVRHAAAGGMVANGQWSPMVAKGFQGPRGTPGMGEMSYNQIDHIQVIFLHDIQNWAISPLKFPLKKIAVVRGNWLD